MQDRVLASSFAFSTLVHLMIIPAASFLLMRMKPMPVAPLEVSLMEIAEVKPKSEPLPVPPTPKPQAKVEKLAPPKLISKTEIPRQVEPEPLAPAPSVEQQAAPPAPAQVAPGPETGSVASNERKGEAAGGAAGAGALFGGGDVAVVDGAGSAGGGGGTVGEGLGRGAKGNGFGSGGDGTGVAQLARPLAGYQIKPRYPESARRAGAQGVTRLKVRVLENGRVGEVLVEESAGFRDLDFSAMEAVKKWLFEPARRGKETVAVWVHLPVKFELHR
jgi:protein TonB